MNSVRPVPAAADTGVREFPRIGERMALAYLDLWVQETQIDPDRPLAVSQAEDLPRPWDPGSCRNADLRREVWSWLDQVVNWINTQYAWDVAGLIPGCWYRHPHLVHDLGTVADQRRRAGLGLISTPLEEWHRYCLPMFVERMRERAKSFCEETHKDPPGRARILRYGNLESVSERQAWFDNDARDTSPAQDRSASQFWLPQGQLIDPDPGDFL